MVAAITNTTFWQAYCSRSFHFPSFPYLIYWALPPLSCHLRHTPTLLVSICVMAVVINTRSLPGALKYMTYPYLSVPTLALLCFQLRLTFDVYAIHSSWKDLWQYKRLESVTIPWRFTHVKELQNTNSGSGRFMAGCKYGRVNALLGFRCKFYQFPRSLHSLTFTGLVAGKADGAKKVAANHWASRDLRGISCS
jgi:hypothetical protein